jgi:ATP-binding cassette subfamily B protein
VFKKKKFTYFDYFRVTFRCIPLYSIVNIISRIVNALVPSFQALIIAALIDNIISLFNGTKTYIDIIPPLCWLIIILIYSYLNSTLIELFNAKQKMIFSERISCEIIEKRAALQYKCIENEEVWEIITRSCDDTSSKFLSGFNRSMDVVELIVRIISILLLIWFKMWWGAILITVISVPLMWLAYKNGKISYEAFKEANKYERRSSYLREVLTGRPSIDERTLFQFTEKINDKWLKTDEIARKIRLDAERVNYFRMKSSSIITAVLSFIIIAFLLIPVSRQLMSIGLFISLSNQIQNIIHIMSWDLTDLIESITKAKEYLKDFNLFINLPETNGVLLPLNDSVIRVNTIEFKNVSFKYPGTEIEILKDVSFRLDYGKVYALVGPNGAGKTTVIKILTGLYDNYKGDIFINNRNLRDFTSQELRSMFSVIYQDFAKYQISIREILKLGTNKDISDQEMLTALSLAGLESLNLDKQIDLNTSLGRIRHGALDISGGQWQKIAIAHAILRTSPIHVLDEPTASLDPIAESNLYADFKKLISGDINILITHRLGAAKIADEIILLKDGKIMEQGSHEGLIQNSGLYANMFDSQKERYV